MSEEFGPNFITITDEDGNSIELEHLDTIELNGSTYMAFFPVVEEDGEESEESGLILLKVITENGEDLLATIDDEDELNTVYEQFVETLFDEDQE